MLSTIDKALFYCATSKQIKNLFLSFTALSCLAASTAKAQNSTTKDAGTNSIYNKIEVGATGGLSLNYFSNNQPQTGQNTGITGGFLINYKIYKDFSLQLEANYLQQGGQLITFKDDTRYGLPESFNTKNVKNSSYKLNSIEIPLLVNYTFQLKQDWKPSVYTGASYAVNTNVNEHYNKTGDLLPGEDVIGTVTGSQFANSKFNSSRLNFIVGANAKLPLTTKFKLLIDLRYAAGLTPARDNYSYMEKAGFGTDIRSNSFISKIGIIMPLQ